MAKRRRREEDRDVLAKEGYTDFLETYPDAALMLDGLKDWKSGKFFSPRRSIFSMDSTECCLERICRILKMGLGVRNVCVEGEGMEGSPLLYRLCDAIAASPSVRSVTIVNAGLTAESMYVICDFFRSKKWRHIQELNLRKNPYIGCCRNSAALFEEDDDYDELRESEKYTDASEEYFADIKSLLQQQNLKKLYLSPYAGIHPRTQEEVQCIELDLLEKMSKMRLHVFNGPYLLGRPAYESVDVTHRRKVEALLRRIFRNQKLKKVSLPVRVGVYDDVIVECLRTHPTLERINGLRYSDKVQSFLREFPPSRRRDAHARRAWEDLGEKVLPRVLMQLVASFLPSMNF